MKSSPRSHRYNADMPMLLEAVPDNPSPSQSHEQQAPPRQNYREMREQGPPSSQGGSGWDNRRDYYSQEGGSGEGPPYRDPYYGPEPV